MNNEYKFNIETGIPIPDPSRRVGEFDFSQLMIGDNCIKIQATPDNLQKLIIKVRNAIHAFKQSKLGKGAELSIRTDREKAIIRVWRVEKNKESNK